MKKFITSKLQDKEFFGHPVGLFVLFLTEMWERFSYYGMRALLFLYMSTYLISDPEKAGYVWGFGTLKAFLEYIFGTMTVLQISSQLYGLYTGFVYFTPFLGGLLADKLLGRYRTVYLGGLLMAIGHFLMASENMFLLALLFLILGNGCFKPNISTQVGALYKEKDQRRDSAYVIFYMGINLGAFLSPFICGTLGQVVGWHWGFGAAGVGMILGLIIYWLGSDLVPKEQKIIKKKDAVPIKEPLTKSEWLSIFVISYLCLLNISFWAVFEQQGSILQYWANERVDWVILGWTMPSTWMQALNPLFIFMLGPLSVMLWSWQRKRKKEPTSIQKMAIGSFLNGGAYVVLLLVTMFLPSALKVNFLLLVLNILMFTIGEMYLSPIGFSLVTKVAPVKLVSTMMGVWFLSSFFGNYLTGFIGTYYDRMSNEKYFTMLIIIGASTGFIFLLSKRFLDKMLHKDEGII